MSDPEDAIREAAARLSMPVGEAIFTQRAIRRFRPDPISMSEVKLILGRTVPEREEQRGRDESGDPAPSRATERSAFLGAPTVTGEHGRPPPLGSPRSGHCRGGLHPVERSS